MAKPRRTGHKIADKIFWNILEESCGLYGMAAKIMEDRHGVSITRQAVRQRALKKPDRVEAIEKKVLDIAESALISNMTQKVNLSVKQRAVEFYLRTKGKRRGYSDFAGALLSESRAPVIQIVPRDQIEMDGETETEDHGEAEEVKSA